MTRSFVLSSSLVALMMAAGSNAEAHWVEDGIPAAPALSLQISPVVAPDGQGGAIIAWSDDRNAASTGQDIYVQRLDAHGNPLWAAGGVPICTAPGDAVAPGIASDGAGGAIIVWQDNRSITSLTDIYAQRVDAGGNPLWLANGAVVCNASQQQTNPRLYATGAIAIVTWEDRRNGNQDIYVQRLSEDGSALWTSNGVALCTAGGDQRQPFITTDGASGAIVTWYDLRNGDFDVYARAINFFGTPQWTYNGVAVGVDAGTSQRNPHIVPDGAGGAIIVWQDDRFLPGSSDIFAQRLNYAGSALWPANGVRVCFADQTQIDPDLVSDGAGGAIIAWSDGRSLSRYDIYAQHLSSFGSPLWTVDGLLVAANPSAFYDVTPSLVSDDAGGAIIVWEDQESGGWSDIYAQRVDAYGQMFWAPNGAPVSTAPDYQNTPTIVNSDGAVVVAWTDYRTGFPSNGNVFAQRLEMSHGEWGHPEPGITAAGDNPGDQGGQVVLEWAASERDAFPLQEVTHYSIWRAVNGAPAAADAGHTASETGAHAQVVALPDIDRDFRGPAFRVEHTAAADYYWEFIGTQDAIAAPGYSDLVPTRQDSTGASTALHYFQVVAHTSDPQLFFASAPDSAYSVDNLAPAAPIALAAMRAGDTAVDLDWSPSGAGDPDLLEYRIYRSTTAGFPTDPAHFLVATPDTTAIDGAAASAMSWYYKVVAVDVHGNHSDDSNEAAVPLVTAVGDDRPAVTSFVLRPNSPNPFRTATTLRFGLPSAGAVTLAIYDVAGHRVVSRELPPMAAGWRSYAFDGRDDAGGLLPNGVYFYRIRPAGMPAAAATTRKMVIER